MESPENKSGHGSPAKQTTVSPFPSLAYSNLVSIANCLASRDFITLIRVLCLRTTTTEVLAVTIEITVEITIGISWVLVVSRVRIRATPGLLLGSARDWHYCFGVLETGVGVET
ncbi:hypothetical protein BaRGS_00036898 [Batillaria attramentaria]|uniref:Uncharacterized protein n=1 Tax=Batillaria attramentaria TaxID=370345 RepID=A0ABD0JAW1_9CAEN